MANKITIHQDILDYKYLFPHRDGLPEVNEHIYSEIFKQDISIDRYIVEQMMKPENLGWTCSLLFQNISRSPLELFPFQIAVLRKLWSTPFPVLVASRGASKTFLLAIYAVLRAIFDPGCKIVIVGAGLRQARLVFNYIESLWENSPILREMVGTGKKAGPRQNVDLCYFKIGRSIVYAIPLGDGCVSPYTTITYDDCITTMGSSYPQNQQDKSIINHHRKIWGNNKFNLSDEVYCNGKSETKKIRTRCGYLLEGTLNHKIKVINNGYIIWERLDQLKINDRVLIDKSLRWHNGETDITPEEGYAAGLLVGNGCYTNKYNISYRTIDHEKGKALSVLGKFDSLPSDCTKYVLYGIKKVKNILDKFGTDFLYSHQKYIPINILRSNKNVMKSFLSGIFDTDSGAQFRMDQKNNKGNSVSIEYSTTSEKLVNQLKYILLHFGIISGIYIRPKRHKNWHIEHVLSITGKDILKFHNEIGFKCIRKNEAILRSIQYKKRWMNQNDIIPDVLEDMIDIATNNRAKRNTGNCIPVCAAILKVRETASRDLVDHFLRVYGHIDDSRIDKIRNLNDPDIYYDEITSIEDSECVTFDVHVPETHEYCANGFYSHNTKIRGFRASVVIADEFQAVPKEIFDIVVRGFASTSRTPIEAAKQKVFQDHLKKLGMPNNIIGDIVDDNSKVDGNQIIISGTAYYQFNHFYGQYNQWKKIIQTKGDLNKVAEIFGSETNIPDGFNYKDYAVIRIPHTHLPDGLLDPRQLAHSKATLPHNVYLMEYGGIFVGDSDGYFPRSLLELCTIKPNQPLLLSGEEIYFTPMMRGENNKRYVMGVDPAAERDNLIISVLELNPTHCKIVYCWSVNKKEFEKRKKQGLEFDGDYYEYSCDKIRTLYGLFKPERIEMDSQGGGYALSELLRNKKILDKNKDQFPIYEIIDKKNPSQTDGEIDGPHVIHLVQQSSDFNTQANLALKTSFETRRLLFPAFDSVQMESAIIAENANRVKFDTYEDCAFEIEEMKNEICTIKLTETATGRQKFDTPTTVKDNTILGTGAKGRIKKDRYTALLLAHKYWYDMYQIPTDGINYDDVVGNFGHIKKAKSKESKCGPAYIGPGVGRFKNSKEWSGTRGGFHGIKRGEKI